MNICKTPLLFTIFAFVFAITHLVQAKKDVIVFGQTGDFYGHFRHCGNAIKQGIQTAFDEANRSGGIHGKKLKLISLNDYGETETAKQNIIDLNKKHGASYFIGVMGTRGIMATLPLLKEGKICQLFPWGSDQDLNKLSLSNVINITTGLESQLDAIADYVINKLRLKKVAIFYADDTFSSNGATYLETLLTKAPNTFLAKESFNRFTMDIENHGKKLLEHDPKVVICISANEPATTLIDYFFQEGHFNTTFLGIDSTFVTQKTMTKKGCSFRYSSLVPDPLLSTSSLAIDYRNTLGHNNMLYTASTLSFLYYTMTKVLIDTLKASTVITPTTISRALQSIKNRSFGEITISFDQTTQKLGIQKVWII